MPVVEAIPVPPYSACYVDVTVPEAEIPWSVDEGVEDPTAVDRWQVGVYTIIDRQPLGEILQANVVSYSRGLDGGELRFTVPTTDPSIIPTLGAEVVTWGTRRMVKLRPVNRALVVCRNGLPVDWFVMRGQPEIRNGTIHITAQTPDRLFADRIVGTAERLDYLHDRGSFEFGQTLALIGFEVMGDCEAELTSATSAHGARSMRIRGNPLTGFVKATATLTSDRTGIQRVSVRGSALIRLPDDAHDDDGLMTIRTRHLGEDEDYWPTQGRGNSGAAVVTGDMERDQWLQDPISAVGLLAPPPYSMHVVVTMFPTSSTNWTYFDDVRIFKRDSLGTSVSRDLIIHLEVLLRDAQLGRGKSTWMMPIRRGTPTGVSEIGVWRHEDDQPLPDALAALAGRDDGPDMPWVDANWTIHVTKRRGIIRDDLVIGPDDIIGDDGWSVDVGNQVSSMRGITDRGDAYWRVESEAIDTTRTGGQIIERISRAPNGMSIDAVDAWTRAQLAQHAQPQDATRIVVRGSLGRTIAVGDSFRVVKTDGGVYLDSMMRCTTKTVFPETDLAALDMGAEN